MFIAFIIVLLAEIFSVQGNIVTVIGDTPIDLGQPIDDFNAPSKLLDTVVSSTIKLENEEEELKALELAGSDATESLPEALPNHLLLYEDSRELLRSNERNLTREKRRHSTHSLNNDPHLERNRKESRSDQLSNAEIQRDIERERHREREIALEREKDRSLSTARDDYSDHRGDILSDRSGTLGTSIIRPQSLSSIELERKREEDRRREIEREIEKSKRRKGDSLRQSQSYNRLRDIERERERERNRDSDRWRHGTKDIQREKDRAERGGRPNRYEGSSREKPPILIYEEVTRYVDRDQKTIDGRPVWPASDRRPSRYRHPSLGGSFDTRAPDRPVYLDRRPERLPGVPDKYEEYDMDPELIPVYEEAHFIGGVGPSPILGAQIVGAQLAGAQLAQLAGAKLASAHLAGAQLAAGAQAATAQAATAQAVGAQAAISQALLANEAIKATQVEQAALAAHLAAAQAGKAHAVADSVGAAAVLKHDLAHKLKIHLKNRLAQKITEQTALSGLAQGAALTGAVHGAALSGAAHGAALSGAAHGAALSGAAHGAALSGAAHGAALSGAAHGATLSGAAHGSALTGAAQGTALSGAAHGIALGGAAHGAALSGAVHGAALTGAAQGAALTGAAHGAALSGASHAAALSGAAHGAAQSGAAHGAALGGAVHVAALGGAAHGAALSGAAHGAALGGAVHGAALGGAAHGAALSGAAHGAALGGALSGAAHGVALSGAAHGAALSGAAHGTALSGAAHGAALSGFRIADSAHFIKAREHLLQRLKLFKPYFKIAGGSGYTMPTSIPRIPVGVELTHVEVEALPTIAIQSPVTLSTPPVSIPGLKGVLKPPLDSEYVEYILALPDEIFQNVALMSKREFLLTLFPTLFRDSVRDLTFEKIVEEPSLSYGAPIYPPLASPPPITPADSYGAPPPLDSYGAPPEDSYGAPPTFSVHSIALPYPSTPHIQVTTHHPIITTISDSYEAPKAPSHSYGPPSPPIITTPAPPLITTLPPFIITSPAAPGEHYGPPDPPSEGYGAPQPPKAPSPIYGVPPKAHHCHHDGNYHHDSTSAQKVHDSFHDVTHKPLFTLKPSSIFSSTSGHQTFFTSTPITPIATSSSYADLDGLGEENTHFGKYHILKGGKIVPDITNTVVHTGTTKSLSQFQAYKNHHLTTPHFKPSPIDASPHATNIPIEIKIHEADFGPGPIHVTISEPSNGKGPIYVTTSQPHFDRHNTSVSASLTMPFPSVGSNFNVVTLRPPRGGSSNIRNTTKKSPVGFHFPTSSPFKFPPIKPAVVSSTHNPTPTVILGVGLRPHGSEQEFFSPVTSTISPPFTSIATLFPKTTVIPTTARPSPLTSISSLIPTTTVIPKTTLYPLTSIFSTTTARPITSSSSVAVVTPAILTNSYTHTVPSTTVAPHTSSSYIPPLSTTSSVAATTSRPFSTTSLKPNFLTTIKDIVTSLRPSLTTTRPPFIITPQPVYTTPKPDLRPTFSSTINPLFTTTIRSFPTTVAPSTSYSIPGGSFPSTGGFPPILGNFPITSDSFPTSIGSFPTTLGSFPTTFPSTTSSTNNPFIPVTTSSPIQPETSPVFVIQETPATPTSSTVFTLSPSVINNGQFLPTRPSSDDNDAILISDIVNTTPGTVLMKIKAGNQGNVFDRIPGTDENDDSHILSPFLKRKGNATHPQTGHTVTSSNRGSKTFIGSPPEEGADGADENNWQPLGPEVQDESSFIVRDCRGDNGVLPSDNVPETLISSKDYDANDPFSLYSDAIDSILSNKASRLNLSFSSFSNNSSSAAASTSHMSQDEFPDVEDVDDIDISANEYYDPKDPFKLYSDVIEDILLKKFIRLKNHSAPLNDNKNKSSTNDVFGDPPLDLSFSGIPPQSFIDVQVSSSTSASTHKPLTSENSQDLIHSNPVTNTDKLDDKKLPMPMLLTDNDKPPVQGFSVFPGLPGLPGGSGLGQPSSLGGLRPPLQFTPEDLAKLPPHLKETPPCAVTQSNRSFCLMPQDYPSELGESLSENHKSDIKEVLEILRTLPSLSVDITQASSQLPSIDTSYDCESEERTVELSWSRDILGSWFVILQSDPFRQPVTVTTCSSQAREKGCRPLLQARPLLAFHPKDPEPRPLIFEFPLPVACVYAEVPLESVARDQPLISKFLDYDLAFDLDDDFLVSKLGVIHNPDETHPDTLQHEFTPSSDQHLTSHRESPRTPSFNVVTSSLENETVPPRNVLSVLNKTTHVNSVPHLVESSIPLIPTTLPAPLIQPNLLTSLLNKSLPIIPLTSLFDEFPLNPVTSDDQQTPIIPVISKEDQPIRYIPKSSSSIPSSLFPPYPDTIPEILDFESIDKTVKEDMMRVEIDFARGHATLCSSQKILLLLSCFFAVLIQR